MIIRESAVIALGTLANETAIKVGSGVSLTEDFRILKSEICAFVKGLTAGEGEGLILGIANNEMAVAELAGAITVDGRADRNDRSGKEAAGRWVKLLSMIDPRIGDLRAVFKNKAGGPIIVSKDRWTYSDPEGWTFFVYNASTALTTGATAIVVATHYGVWVT